MELQKPTITDFTLAAHTHVSDAQGGLLSTSSIIGLSANYATISLINQTSAYLQSEIEALSAAVSYNSTHNNLLGLQGGNSNERYHLSASQFNDYIGRTETAAISASLQTQIDNLDLNYATDASLAAISGILQTNITNLNTSVIATSAYLQSEIDALSAAVSYNSTHNNLLGLQGGTTNEYYHLSVSQFNDYIGKTEVSGISASLQTQIDNLDLNYATDASLAAISGILQTNITNLNTSVIATSAYLQNQVTINANNISSLISITGNLQSQITSNTNNISSLISITGNLQSQITSNTNNISSLIALSGGHIIQDEGTPLTMRRNLNFVGSGVAVTDDAVNNATIVTVSISGGGGGGHTIQDEGTPLTQRTKLNFVGTGVTVTDDAGNDATVVTISGGTSSSPLTTKGDLYTYSTVDARLPIGLSGQFLMADPTTSTGLKWNTMITVSNQQPSGTAPEGAIWFVVV